MIQTVIGNLLSNIYRSFDNKTSSPVSLVVRNYQVVDFFITNKTGEVMKNSLIKTLVITSLLIGPSLAIAGSNNGYTSAANVYTGSSSRTWFGAGGAHVLAEWKKERAISKAVPVEPAVEDQSSSPADSISN